MFDASVFVPGKRRLTNGMLTDLRAAGVYAGRAAEMGRKPRAGFDKFAAETEAIRMATMVAWCEWRKRGSQLTFDLTALAGRCFATRFFVTGHHRHDPDAWYLLGKAARDGFAAAFGVSDRFRMGETGGVVAQSEGECYFPEIFEGDRRGWKDSGQPGFWMRVWAP